MAKIIIQHGKKEQEPVTQRQQREGQSQPRQPQRFLIVAGVGQELARDRLHGEIHLGHQDAAGAGGQRHKEAVSDPVHDLQIDKAGQRPDRQRPDRVRQDPGLRAASPLIPAQQRRLLEPPAHKIPDHLPHALAGNPGQKRDHDGPPFRPRLQGR